MVNPADNTPAHVSIFGTTVESEGADEQKTQPPHAKKKKECEWGEQGESSSSFGLVFLAGGIILLLNTLGFLPWEFWYGIRDFWPLLIIFAGAHIMLGESLVARFILFLLTLVAVVYIIAFALVEMGSPFADYIPLELLRWIEVTN